jgi:uncharacterized coiled-coil protein SlyX
MLNSEMTYRILQLEKTVAEQKATIERMVQFLNDHDHSMGCDEDGWPQTTSSPKEFFEIK